METTFGIVDDNGEIIGTNICPCRSLYKKSIGLIGVKELKKGEGILIYGCSSVHTFFMDMTIDVLFMDKNFNVLKKIISLPPWKLTLPVWRSYYVLELGEKSLISKLKKGQKLELICIN